MSNHESADSSGARACGTPDKASKAARNIFETTCEAANGIEGGPAKLKPATSPKLKPAASIQQSSNGAIESNLQFKGFLWGPKTPPDARRRPPQAAAGWQNSDPASF